MNNINHLRTSQQTMYWEVPECKREPGRPRTNWRSIINRQL